MSLGSSRVGAAGGVPNCEGRIVCSVWGLALVGDDVARERTEKDGGVGRG